MKQVSGRAALPPGHGTPVATPLPSGPGSGACFTLSKSSSNSMLGAGRRPSRLQTKKAFCRNQVHDVHLQKKKKCQHLVYLTFLIRKGSHPSFERVDWQTSGVRFEHIYVVSQGSPPCFVRKIPNLASRHKHIAQKQGFVGQPHEVNV